MARERRDEGPQRANPSGISNARRPPSQQRRPPAALVADEKRARAVADLIVESFEPAEAASTAFETEEPWPGGGKAWLVEAYFGFAPDEDSSRELVAAAAGEDAAGRVEFGLTESATGSRIARRPGAGQGRALPRPRRARPRRAQGQRRR